MAQEIEFNCVIDDRHLNDRFSALVKISKKNVVKVSERADRIALAHIYITPISDQLRRPRFPLEPVLSSHNHFILYEFSGYGKYIVRNRYGRNVIKRERCSIWDLGNPFAIKVMAALKNLT